MTCHGLFDLYYIRHYIVYPGVTDFFISYFEKTYFYLHVEVYTQVNSIIVERCIFRFS